MIAIEYEGRAIDSMVQRYTVLALELPQGIEDAVTAELPDIDNEVRQDFAQGGRAPSGPWAENAEITKQRKGHSMPLVGASGHPRASGVLSEGFEYSVERVEHNIVSVFTWNRVVTDSGYNLWRLHFDGRGAPDERKSGLLADESARKIGDNIQSKLREKVDAVLATT